MKRATGMISCCLAVAAIGLLLLSPTILIGFQGGFRSRQVSSERSSDGKLEVVVTKRVAFPANEWVDPSIVVRAELRDAATLHVIASQWKSLIEDSDFRTPIIEWSLGEVRVIGFDGRNDQSLLLKLRPES